MVNRGLAVLGVSLLLCGCATSAGIADPEYAPLFHYVRSNQDGSSPENIYVYRRDAVHLEVAKQVNRCTNSAYVTATLDPDRNQPLALTGGRLTPELTQEAFAWLTYDPNTRGMHLSFPRAGVESDVAVDGEPWMIYDFDLADVTGLRAGRSPARQGFRMAVGLLWGQGSAWTFNNLGFADARYIRTETHNGRQTLQFQLSGSLTGPLWLDASEGFVVEARFDQPNHAGYDDFRLVLQDVYPNGEAQWEAVRRAHWQDCGSVGE